MIGTSAISGQKDMFQATSQRWVPSPTFLRRVQPSSFAFSVGPPSWRFDASKYLLYCRHMNESHGATEVPQEVLGVKGAEGPSRWRWLAGGLALVFGLATIVEGGHTLFGAPTAETAKAVPFVVIFNFAAGFFYVVTGLATMAARAWAVWLARSLAVLSALVLVAFVAHVLSGGAYLSRTLGAMPFRTAFWIVQALVLPGLLRAR